MATSAAFPDRTFEVLVATIDSRIDATSRAFKVRALLPNPDLLLPAGMFMQIAVVLESRLAVMIPEEAVIVQGDRTFVYVVADGKATARDVVIGHREVGAVEVTHGLLEGEAVVIRFESGYEVWVYRLADDLPPKPRTTQAGSKEAERDTGSEFVILFAPSGLAAKIRMRLASQPG